MLSCTHIYLTCYVHLTSAMRIMRMGQLCHRHHAYGFDIHQFALNRKKSPHTYLNVHVWLDLCM